MENINLFSEALNKFKNQYPHINSGDLQTFAIGWQQCVKQYNINEMKSIQVQIDEKIKNRFDIFCNNPESEQVDVLSEEIFEALKQNFDSLSIDYILESLFELGGTPNLINDDNGNFQFTSMCISPIVYDDDKIDGQIISIVEKDKWFPTIREALKNYIFS